MKRSDIFLGLAAAVFLAVFSFLASKSPDGLEKLAEDKNFISQAHVTINSPLPDYLFPGIKSKRLATAASGMSGVLLVFVLGLGLGKMLKRR